MYQKYSDARFENISIINKGNFLFIWSWQLWLVVCGTFRKLAIRTIFIAARKSSVILLNRSLKLTSQEIFLPGPRYPST